MADRETIIETGDGGAAGVIAGMVLVAIIAIGAFLYFGGMTGSQSIIDVNPPPAVTVNVQPQQ